MKSKCPNNAKRTAEILLPLTGGSRAGLTQDASKGDLQETYLPAIGGPWHTQDLSTNHTPNTKQAPTALLHYDTGGGLTWTSVYSIDDSGNLWETYLPAMGDSWTSQDLSSTGGTLPGTPDVSLQQPVTGNG
jgi:hypothetical protein